MRANINMKRLLLSLVVSGVCFAYPITNDDNERITIGLGTGVAEKDTSGDEGSRASDDGSTSRPLTPSAVLGFMKRFGYLAAGAPNTEALYTEEAVIGAISQMQRFGGLYPTGIVDKATLELLEKPRCGNHDTTRDNGKEARRRYKRYIVGAEGWRRRTVSYHLANWSSKLWNETFVQGELDRAFAAWADYANLKFVPISDYHSADIVVSFGRYSHGDYYPFDGPGLVLAHAYYPYEFGHFGGDIHFDDDEDWRPDVTELYQGMDFFTVAVHEIGHSLGLSHSPVADSVMYPYYKGPQKSFALGYDDILAMYELYITRDIADDEDTNEDEVLSKKPDDEDSKDADYEDYLADEGDYYNSSNDKTTTKISKPSTTTTTTYSTATTTTYSTATTTTTTVSNENSTATYQGDVEDVDDHIKRTRNKTGGESADICSGHLDAIGHLRGELFMFLGRRMWRFHDRGNLRQGYPAEFQQMFQFPEELDRIDAVYERTTDGSIIFFSGRHYWINNGNQFIDGSPRPLTDLGLPADLAKLDAAFVWGKNKKTYMFSGDQYWRYDERRRSLEAGYPRNIKNWRGVPGALDGVLTWRDGLTYFFKGGKYWRFDDDMVITDSEFSLPMAKYWAGC